MSDPQQLAEHVGRSMYERDAASQALGMVLASIGPGFARMTMTVRPDMLNGHHICHGGLIFTLADSTFAYACNSHNRATVASGCSIEFLKPGRPGDLLTAEGREQTLSGRNGIYDIRVTNGHGETIAMFRGKSMQLRESVIREDT
jgi:acyl-CoA thioesterase